MTTPISSLRTFNGMSVPSFFDPSKIDEYALKEQNCQKLKAELGLELKRSNYSQVTALFKERGAEFLTEMFYVEPWATVNDKGKSILEKVLQEMDFELPNETLAFLLTYLITHSEQVKNTHMNFLHLLARNCSSYKVIGLLKLTIEKHPALLKDRMTLSEGLDMTPVEMTIRTSYNEALMNFMITKYQETVGCLTSEDKSKLLSHARWLSSSKTYSTALIGQRLMERIKVLPEVLQ